MAKGSLSYKISLFGCAFAAVVVLSACTRPEMVHTMGQKRQRS